MKSLTLFFAFFVTHPLMACEDTVPGALPPAPHGGIVEPMRTLEFVETTEGQSNKPPDDVFFEARYRNKELKLYPLTIALPKTAIFANLSAKADFSEISARVEFPREGKTMDLALTPTDEALVAPLQADEAHRFLIYLTAKHRGVEKRVKIQLENE